MPSLAFGRVTPRINRTNKTMYGNVAVKYTTYKISKQIPLLHNTIIRNRSMRKTTLCKETSESRGCSSSLIGQKFFFWRIRSGQFKRFWDWFSKSKCPGAHIDLTVNFHHRHFINPTNCPWVSEDGLTLTWSIWVEK